MYAVLRSYKRFEALRNFTLESGQEEIDRQGRVRKDKSENGSESPAKTSFSEETRIQPQRTLSGTETPTSPSQFEIGDDDDSDDEVKPNSQSSATPQTVTPPVQSPDPSAASSVEDAVPLQLRGMSEKARGKLPEGAFQRQGSTTSLASHVSSNNPRTPSSGFSPSPAWVGLIFHTFLYCVLSIWQIETWLPHLPLHTILILIQQLQPQLKSVLSSNNNGVQESNATPMLERIRTTEVHGIEPSLIKTHMFEWSPLALGWYESLLWGFIFVSERHVAKGTVGVWNGTAVKLFRVQETAPEGPSLLAPRGGVDAIGTNLIERLGNVSLGRGQSQSQSQPQARTGVSDNVGARERRAVV